jgi:gliding motility-associated-like protein
VIIVPNVFTPNGDETNDLFFLDVTNQSSITLTIVNRWGNKMFEGTGINPAWNGKTTSGALADEGTYFYKYLVTGVDGSEFTGHGFLQLVRK